MSSADRHRSIVFTLNNYTESEFEHIKSLVSREKVKYIRVQEEVGGENGTPHLQGWCQKSNGATFSAWKRILGADRVHLEVRNGSVESNEAYCSKDETRKPGTESFSAGEIPASGT